MATNVRNLIGVISVLMWFGVLPAQGAATDSFKPDFESAAALYQQQNYVTAFPAFLALAQSGDARAQTVTALMYKFGEGTEQNFEEAYRWYLAAAEQGYPAGQYHTGVMLADGLGVESDEVAAVEWLSLAVENGFSRAVDKLAALNASANVLGRASEELTPWSTDWDLKLPMELILGDIDQEPLEPNPVYLVQVGAMGTRSSANRLWEVLSTHHTRLFENRAPIITLVENANRRVYRIQTGPFSDFRSADEFCNRLMASTIQAGCLPIKQN